MSLVREVLMLLEMAGRIVQFFFRGLADLLLSPGSSLSLASLLSALCVAIAFLVVSRRSRKKRVKYQVLLRALFPKWLRRASFRADVRFLFLNVFAFGTLLGWAVLSLQFVSDSVASGLADTFGVMPKTGLSDFTNRSIATV